MNKTLSFLCEFIIDLILGLWVGGSAMIVLSVVRIFGVLKKTQGDNGLAGAVAQPIFNTFFLLLLIAWIVMVVAMLARKLLDKPPSTGTRGVVTVFLLLLMFGATVAVHCFVSPRMAAIRADAGVGETEPLPEGSDARKAFMKWHRISETLMMLSTLFGAGVIGLRVANRNAAAARRQPAAAPPPA